MISPGWTSKLTLLQETWRLAELLRTDLPRDQRRPIMRSLRENAEVLVPMLDAERDREFYRLGLDFGYAENEALQFVDYLNGIIEVTSIRPVFDALRPRRPPGFGGTNRVPREP